MRFYACFITRDQLPSLMRYTSVKASDYIACYIADRGVRHVFELIGGMTTHMLDSISRLGRTEIVTMHHEQSAAFAVDAAGRITQKPAVALATSGPGATNLLTGIGSCYYDSVPSVFMTGQVNRNELRGDRNVRQLGFQETDIVSIAKPLTKFSYQILSPEELPEILDRAFEVAISGRPGPVLLDIPMDIQRAGLSAVPALPTRVANSSQTPVDLSVFIKLVQAISHARKPLILAGGGIHSAGALPVFRRVVEKLRIPVVSSLMAVDVLPYDDKRRVGMIGTYGNRWANLVLGQSDLIIVIGSRLDVRQTGSDVEFFKKDRKLFHFDCDPYEINNRVQGCEEILGDLKDTLKILEDLGSSSTISDSAIWMAEIEILRAKYPDVKELDIAKGINPNIFLHELSASSNKAAAYVVDVGQHQMWAAQSLELTSRQRFLSSGGMGSMGFALPAAIGACFSTNKSPIVMIAGDGGFQCNLQELQTVVRNRLPIKMVIIDNGCLGMVRQFQESYFDCHYQSTVIGYDAPDFSAVARAYGIAARTISTSEESADGCNWLWRTDGPVLLHVIVSSQANAYPKIAFGSPLTIMVPDR